jgi:glycosyltransferase involved in cell wall biosynthesis
MPKVSIVLPNYNYARYLDERIQSLLNQTYKDFELIILDDASTDNSLEVIEKYTADPRVKTQFYSENSGLPYKRWNDGADLAKGEYLLIAGADDSCNPKLLEKLVEKLDSYPSVGLVYAQSWGIDSQGNRTHLWKTHTDKLDKDRWAQDFVDSGKNEFKYLLNKNTIPNASALLMRRQIFIEAGKFDVELRLTADWMLWAKMLMTSDIAFVAEPLNYFRTHPNTVRSGSEKSGLNINESYQVQKYILSQLSSSLEKTDISGAFDEMAEYWVNLVIKERRLLSIKHNLKIYQIASCVDTQLNMRLLTKSAISLFEEIKKPLRKLKLKLI